MHLNLEWPEELCGTGMVCAVNAFSEHVLHTRITPVVSEQTNLDLRAGVDTLVC